MIIYIAGILMISLSNIFKSKIVYWTSRAITFAFALFVSAICFESFYEVVQNALNGEVLKSYLLANGDFIKAFFRILAFTLGLFCAIIMTYYAIRPKQLSKFIKLKQETINGIFTFIPMLVILNFISVFFVGLDDFSLFFNGGIIGIWVFIITLKQKSLEA